MIKRSILYCHSQPNLGEREWFGYQDPIIWCSVFRQIQTLHPWKWAKANCGLIFSISYKQQSITLLVFMNHILIVSLLWKCHFMWQSFSRVHYIIMFIFSKNIPNTQNGSCIISPIKALILFSLKRMISRSSAHGCGSLKRNLPRWRHLIPARITRDGFHSWRY